VSAPAAVSPPAPASVDASTTTGVVRAGPEHLELLADFYRRTWDPAATLPKVRAARRAAAARNPVHPGEEPPTFLFLAGGKAVGHVGTLPVRLWTAAGERSAHWVKGLMVLPEHRNGPVGFFLVREAVRHLGCALAMVVAPEARKLFAAAGFTDLGALPDAVRLLDPARVLRCIDPESLGAGLPRAARSAAGLLRRSPLAASAAGALASAALGAWTGMRGSGGGERAVVLPELPPGEAARLWARVRRALPAAPARDYGYLQARYAEAGGYRLLGVQGAGGLAGFAAVRPPRADGDPRLAGVRLATVSELVFPPERPRVARALLAGSEAVARSLDADALVCAATHPAAAEALRRRAYLPFPGTVHVLLREAPGEPPLPRSLAAWWLTRGDSHADEVF
jgi:GNAT superfamily N-acetyltransferase